MKKIIIILPLLFILSGCTAEYNVEIYNDRFIEDIKVEELNPSNFDNDKEDYTIRELLREEYNRDNYYYDKKFIEDSNRLLLKYDSDFSLDTYSTSSVGRRCYEYFNVLEKGTTTIISTSIKNTCIEDYVWLDKLVIKVKTNHIVKKNNADSFENGVYTWNFDRNNYKEKGIYFEYSDEKYIFNYDNEYTKKVVYIIVIVGIILLVIGIIVFVLSKKRKNSNKI